ncbi:BREX system Lon protease-like protein BrxL [Mycolicibacterium sp. S3B2]|uniref:BREX system Lon protease-like protein BrxL n=1 Tax=Mycolicibacterium sp. S3B2 TaxID=3415120 RepID=UPI003C7DB4D1
MTDTPVSTSRPLSALDTKANEAFPGFVVRKDLPARVRGNAVVPGYVLEFLLAQYCATDDEATIEAGITSVRDILATHYVDRGQAELIKSTIRDRGRHRIIDKVAVVLDDRNDIHTASFANLGLRGVPIDDSTVKRTPKLLTGGVWCLADLEYVPGEASSDRWIIAGLKPIQLGQFDADHYLQARRQFSSDEWIDLLIQSVGFDPERLSPRAKLLQVTRLIPFVERNYNLVELGPKGTGKSHVYSELSPHGMLISGGEVTVPKLFVNNSNGRIGLVGFWDVVAFDEFAGQKRVDRALVDIMKNYMANKTFSRGVETIGAAASMAFIGNTSRPVPAMLAHSDLFDALPESYHDPAYLDRLHCYLPGWEVEIIRRELFTDGYGFVVDYLAEALAHLRAHDFSDGYTPDFTLSEEISTRDRDGVRKTFSGLMKLIHPHREATADEVESLLRFAIEGRKRVKDQILRIDRTMDDVRFGYSDPAGTWHDVATQEELDFPHFYRRVPGEDPPAEPSKAEAAAGDPRPAAMRTGPVDIPENALGYSFAELFVPYLAGASRIDIVDPYLRAPHQLRNLYDLLVALVVAKPADEIQSVHVVTGEETSREDWQRAQLTGLAEIKDAVAEGGIELTCDFGQGLHDRQISTNTGWRIILGRGLDIFQPFTANSRFDMRLQRQDRRRTKACTITYVRS